MLLLNAGMSGRSEGIATFINRTMNEVSEAGLMPNCQSSLPITLVVEEEAESHILFA